MIIEMHVHSIFSDDSELTPEDIIKFSRRRNVDAVCITDHDTMAGKEYFKKLSFREKFPIFIGMEYSSSDNHVLLYGVEYDDFLSVKHRPMQQVIDYVNNKGGTAIPAHPYQEGYKYYLGDKIYNLKGIAAAESINRRLPDEMNKLAQEACENIGIKQIAGSDSHFSSNLGKVVTEFETTDIVDEITLVRALKNKKYWPLDLRVPNKSESFNNG